MKSQSRRIETVEIAFQILECISTVGPAGTDTTTIVRETGIPKRTVYRHLAHLQDLGLVESRPNGFNLYRLGPTVDTWAASSSRQREFMRLSDAYINELAESTGNLVHCTIFDQGAVLTVAAAIDPESKGQPPLAVAGSRRPAHATASGKVFLAYKPGALASYITRPLAALSPSTITSPAELQAEVHKVRNQGYGEDIHEFRPGVCCVAVPVWGHHGVVGALSISQDWAKSKPYVLDPGLLRSLGDAAKDFTKRIGGNNDH